jgi:choline kinase
MTQEATALAARASQARACSVIVTDIHGLMAGVNDRFSRISAIGKHRTPAHEEAVRDLIREQSQAFDLAAVTGAPCIEIDFSEDVGRAEREILPEL